MAGPDLDLLFGEAPEAPKVHPALLSAVQSLAREAWPRAREELLAGGRARRPLPAALARDLDAALEHLGREEWAACGEKAEAVRSEAWQALMRDKGWQRPCDKETYLLSALLAALAGDAVLALRRADEAFVFAPPGPWRSAALLFVRLLEEEAMQGRSQQRALGAFPRSPPLPQRSDLAAGPAPTAQELEELLKARRPFLFTTTWPLAERWNDLAYLDDRAGHRWVPTELGVVGTEGWREEFMPFGRFLQDYLAPSLAGEGGTAYLAQHELFEQCPLLRADIPVPSAWHQVLGAPSRCNAWIGTRSTVTPCHWDSYDNFLSQLQGFKRVALLPPTAHLPVEAKSGTGAQGNVSPVDLEARDLDVKAEVIWVDLSPGHVLFMPSGWWHQVRGLTPSISVNFWY